MAANREAVTLAYLKQRKFAMCAKWFLRCAAAPIMAAGMLCCGYAYAYADEAPVPSKHQMMKDCMAKQKASDSGRHSDEMKKSCRDITKNQKQNADQAADQAPAPQGAPPHN
jgi:hypothetical protein